MRLKSLVLRLGVVAALASTLGISAGSPASAQEDPRCGEFFGSPSNDTNFGYCNLPAISQYSPGVQLASSAVGLYVGRNATISATGCTISIWATLHKPGGGYWETSHDPSDCMSALRNRGTFILYYNNKHTTATAMKTTFCVYLRYNNSTTPGWSKCQTGGWDYLSATA